jgi:hypothetical protein
MFIMISATAATATTAAARFVHTLCSCDCPLLGSDEWDFGIAKTMVG